MDIILKAVFKNNNNSITITRTLSDGSQNTNDLDINEINKVKKSYNEFCNNKSKELAQIIGVKLYQILDGEKQSLFNALKDSLSNNVGLQLYIEADSTLTELPFEFIYNKDFMVINQINIIRQVSNWGKNKKSIPENRRLKVLVMVSSPKGIPDKISLTDEEAAFLDCLKDLSADIIFENTGTLNGLGKCISEDQYDVVHMICHAGINNENEPYLLLENKEGDHISVTPFQLWEKLNFNLPRFIFISGKNIGNYSSQEPFVSFAEKLITNKSLNMISWGRLCTDKSTSSTLKQFYLELSNGGNILSAIKLAQYELYSKENPDWYLFRIFTDGAPLSAPLVFKDFENKYKYQGSLKKFVGRRREIQKAIKVLNQDEEKLGLLITGQTGAGKSCFMKEVIKGLDDFTKIVIQGKLNSITFSEALKKGFIGKLDREGIKALNDKKEINDKIKTLSTTSFLNRNYVIILENFEQNLMGVKEGKIHLAPDSEIILKALLVYLPNCIKVTQLIIVSRYDFTDDSIYKDLIKNCIKHFKVKNLQEVDIQKKLLQLKNISFYKNKEEVKLFQEYVDNNLFLLEELNIILEEVKDYNLDLLNNKFKVNHNVKYVRNTMIDEIIKTQDSDFDLFVRQASVFRTPVSMKGISQVCSEISSWESYLEKAVKLNLINNDLINGDDHYWIADFIRKKLFENLKEDTQKKTHKEALKFYKSNIAEFTNYHPTISIEIIEHAIKANMYEVAFEEAAKVLPHLRDSFAFREAVSIGNKIEFFIKKTEKSESIVNFLYELGWIYHDIKDYENSIKRYLNAMEIEKYINGAQSSKISKIYNKLGIEYYTTGDSNKALEYYIMAYDVDKEIYGEDHPNVAKRLNNIGLAKKANKDILGARESLQKAYEIFNRSYGDDHANTNAVKKLLKSLV